MRLNAFSCSPGLYVLCVLRRSPLSQSLPSYSPLLTVGWRMGGGDSDSLGGNSAKATSGMNGALSEYQERAHIEDSWQGLQKDTLRCVPRP